MILVSAPLLRESVAGLLTSRDAWTFNCTPPWQSSRRGRMPRGTVNAHVHPSVGTHSTGTKRIDRGALTMLLP
eukprot:8794886-Alexandrium_andersonii.AAC.1